MPIDLTYHRDKGFLQVVVKGDLTADGFKKTLVSMTGSKEYPPDVPTLWDLRDVNLAHFKELPIPSFIDIEKRFPLRDNAKIAVIAQSNFSYGLCRMYCAHLEMALVKQDFMVFRKYDNALAWLLNSQESVQYLH
jgi:hypothetical protein